jgi:hypothetical protein
MSVSDAAGNSAGASQTLTVDTVSPGIVISGGAQVRTSDLDPTLKGTSDAAPGTVVTVSIAGQTMTTLVQADGSWNATPTVVGEGTWTVGASVTDPAGNVGSAGQTLTIALAGAALPEAPPGAPPIAPPNTPPTAPVPGGSPAPDAVAATTVTGAGHQRVKSSSLSIATKVTAPGNGAVVVAATGTVRIPGARTAIRLTRVVARLAAGRTVTLVIRPTGTKQAAAAKCRTISRTARKHRRVTATITVTLSDAFGHTRVVRRSMRLTA